MIVNKIAESALTTIDLEEFLPKDEPVLFDLKDFLFMGLIVKEKEFRESVLNINPEQYRNKTVLIVCSTEAIIPMWAYMLLASQLQPVVKELFLGSVEEWKKTKLLEAIAFINVSNYKDQRVVIKGCGSYPVPEAAYFEITKRLRPVVKSIFYGEPCSTVPIYKQPKSIV